MHPFSALANTSTLGPSLGVNINSHCKAYLTNHMCVYTAEVTYTMCVGYVRYMAVQAGLCWAARPESSQSLWASHKHATQCCTGYRLFASWSI